MKTLLLWQDKIQDANGARQPIWDIAYYPDGTRLIATAGTEVLVYKSEGELIQALRSHKDAVFTVNVSADGKRFASGGADKQVIIWDAETFEGILKYSHNDIIQSVSHNPATGQVLSCTPTDFGLWSAEAKSVVKTKAPSKILTSAWSRDGQFFALGMYNGTVSIRDQNGIETTKVERGNLPVWSLSWGQNSKDNVHLLAVTDWSQRLSFFTPTGKQVSKDRNLNMDPCAVSFSSDADFVVVGGSDKSVTLWTFEGFKIGIVCKRTGWIWCCKVKPNQSHVAVGCQDGTISVHQIVFNTIHGLYNDRYVFRENMTDIVIQHLVSDQRARIKCRDHVKKIAVYKDRLAVQLAERLIIYELFHDDATDMHYRIREKISKKLDCDLLVVTSLHVILCVENKLQLYNYFGEKEREWNLKSNIRYIRVFGGPSGREGLLVGLKNGQILQIFIDNHFPIVLINQTNSIKCLDISMYRKKIAVIDDQNTCFVYDIATKELLYQEPNASSVAWNTEIENVLCYTGNGILNVKSGNFPAFQQQLNGFVLIGFRGSRVFSLGAKNMTTTGTSTILTPDIPFTSTLDRLVKRGDFDEAYKIACLGIPEGDWRRLAMESLSAMNFEVSRKSFVRLRDLKYINLVKAFEVAKSEGRHNDNVCLGDINAAQGKYAEAAKYYKQGNEIQKAIEMYTELNMWDQATLIAQDDGGGSTDILRKKAKMLLNRNELMAAANVYMQIGEYAVAIDIFGPNGWLDNLIEVARKLKKSETKALSRCVYFFRSQNHHTYAAEVLIKMGDIQHLLNLHLDLGHWEDAFKISETHPQFAQQIYLPYANWLAMNDQFVEAQLNYKMAGRLDVAFRVLGQLANNSISEKRYEDGAYYFWTLSMQHRDQLPDNVSAEELNSEQKKTLACFYDNYQISEAYYAYHFVQRYMDEPFTSHQSESLFNMALFVLNYTNRKPVPKGISLATYIEGISRVYVLFALAKLARVLGAYKTARYAYEKLLTCVIPNEWIDMIELGTLTIRSKPKTDRKELMPICYGCGTIHPLTSGTGNMESKCSYCQEPFVNSFYSFEAIPLVRFELEEGISPYDAEKLVDTPSPTSDMGRKVRTGGDSVVGGMVTSVAGPALTDDDPFNRALLSVEKSGTYVPVTLDRQQVIALDKYLVFVRSWGKACIPNQYFKQILVSENDSAVKMCGSCQHFFHDNEWSYQVLQKDSCPFCRSPFCLEG